MSQIEALHLSTYSTERVLLPKNLTPSALVYFFNFKTFISTHQFSDKDKFNIKTELADLHYLRTYTLL